MDAGNLFGNGGVVPVRMQRAYLGVGADGLRLLEQGERLCDRLRVLADSVPEHDAGPVDHETRSEQRTVEAQHDEQDVRERGAPVARLLVTRDHRPSLAGVDLGRGDGAALVAEPERLGGVPGGPYGLLHERVGRRLVFGDPDRELRQGDPRPALGRRIDRACQISRSSSKLAPRPGRGRAGIRRDDQPRAGEPDVAQPARPRLVKRVHEVMKRAA
ncbi:hypothetical protein [Streptomyces albofaciens]|uniref:hypothetical protein n=1 Tax=Streptomyces albofaciens TaxID=66866 RepID=UPI001AD720CF|nr:hypothetical protein [Streptomyces albofaciens]